MLPLSGVASPNSVQDRRSSLRVCHIRELQQTTTAINVNKDVIKQKV